MKQKKERDDSWGVVILICITLLVVLVLCMKIMPKDCVVMFLATVFMVGCYIYFELEQVRVRKAAIFIQAYVTDCEMVDYMENNRRQVKYLLTCEAYDAKFYGNAQVYSENYVPIGNRIVLYYNERTRIFCPKDDVKPERVQLVLLFLAFIFFAMTAVLYFMAQPDMDIFAKENILRVTYFFMGIVMMGLGGAYFYFLAKKKIEQKDRKEMIQYGIIYFVTGVIWAVVSFVCDVI